jgi:hypothetical protein
MIIMSQIQEIDYNIGKTILQQIKTIDFWALGSWGAKDYVLLKNGIQFKVKGWHNQSKIIIKLNGNDTYDIEYGRISKLNWITMEKVDDVYNENLVMCIDRLIKTQYT